MNGTKLPDEINELGKEKEITLYLDGDRGGKLIAQNVMENAKIKYIAVAPDGKEVEELTSKEILMNLRKRVPAEDFFKELKKRPAIKEISKVIPEVVLNDENKAKLREISKDIEGTGKAILLDSALNELKDISAKSVSGSLKRTRGTAIIVIDGTATNAIIKASEEVDVKVIVAKNFQTTDTSIKLLSL
jgi:DNA primase